MGIRSIVSQFQRACKKPAIVALLFLAVFGTTSVVVVAVKYRHSIFAQRAAAVAVAEERSSGDDAPGLLPLASLGGTAAVQAPTPAPVATPTPAKKKTASIKIASFTAADAETAVADTSTKGYYSMPTTGKNWGILHGHNGVDIANSCGTAVKAAADGVVTEIGHGWNGGYGNDVILKHDNGTDTLYAHFQSVSVSVGDEVEQGELLGQMGKTGEATGCHLHFEVHRAKNPFAFK
jgi:murein DD-endopeptidase MepM/ murein hydrolase activator NlpD